MHSQSPRHGVVLALCTLALAALAGVVLPMLSGTPDGGPSLARWTASPPATSAPALDAGPGGLTPTASAPAPVAASASARTPAARPPTATPPRVAQQPAPTATTPPTRPVPAATPTATAMRIVMPTPMRTATSATAAPAAEIQTPAAGATLAAIPPGTETPAVAPTATTTATAVVAVPPALLEPPDGQPVTGEVRFSWAPQGDLPAGAAYEVVWWNAGEMPAEARGVAAPTEETSQSANLDVLHRAGQIRAPVIWWTVLVVRRDPYLRLTAPDAAGARQLVYQPPPPKPRD